MAIEGSLLYKALPWSTREIELENAHVRMQTVRALFYNYGVKHKLSSIMSLAFSLPNSQRLWKGKLEPESLPKLLEVGSTLDAQYSRLKKDETRETLLNLRALAEPLATDSYERFTSQFTRKAILLKPLRAIDANVDRRKHRRSARVAVENAFREEAFALVDSRELKIESLSRFFELGELMVAQIEQDSVVAASRMEVALAEAELQIELDFAVTDN